MEMRKKMKIHGIDVETELREGDGIINYRYSLYAEFIINDQVKSMNYNFPIKPVKHDNEFFINLVSLYVSYEKLKLKIK